MNKSRNQFAGLSEQDRQYILDLCAKHPYEEAVVLLAKPRPEGLNILTSKSALCRFFTTSHPAQTERVLAQCAAAVQIQHELTSNAFLGAIRATVEARVFESLKNGKALAEMDKDFRLLKTAETLYLADARWRANNADEARAAYQAHVERCAKSSDIDFTPIEQSSKDAPAPAELSDFEQDIAKARQKQQIADKQRDRILATLEAAGYGRDKDAPCPAATTTVTPSNSAPEIAKPAVIPHIPLNSTSTQKNPSPSPELIEPAHQSPPDSTPSANPAEALLPRPEASSEPRPAPYSRPGPKIGRNDPCPCGSGVKYKKCCLLKAVLPLAA